VIASITARIAAFVSAAAEAGADEVVVATSITYQATTKVFPPPQRRGRETGSYLTPAIADGS
jgi:hypothetical protein